jgi:outer membrane protein assembly factor BamA
VKQRVLNLRLFREVTVVPEARGGEVDVSIRVVERWTLLPVPIVTVSSRGIRGGIYVLESNLFGWNKLFVVGATYSGEGPSGFALYRDPGVAGSGFLLRSTVRYGDLLREQFVGTQRMYAYRDLRLEGSLSGGYQIAPWLSLHAGWYGMVAESSAAEEEMAPPAAGPLHGWTGELEVRAQDFHLYFNDGLWLRLFYRHALALLGADRDVVELNAYLQFALRLIGDQSTTITAQGLLSEGDPVLDALLLGGLPGTRGFVRLGLWAERSATVTLEHQVPVLRFSWGIWTLNAFGEAGAVEWQDRQEGFVTPGAGIRLYLLGVASPAFGVDVAWSIEDRRPLVMANFGVGQ